MAIPRVVIVPVGKVDPAELEGAAVRAAKVLRATISIREAVVIPRRTQDAARGQHDASRLLGALRLELPRAKTVDRGIEGPFCFRLKH